jgi:hypothetical protein
MPRNTRTSTSAAPTTGATGGAKRAPPPSTSTSKNPKRSLVELQEAFDLAKSELASAEQIKATEHNRAKRLKAKPVGNIEFVSPKPKPGESKTQFKKRLNAAIEAFNDSSESEEDDTIDVPEQRSGESRSAFMRRLKEFAAQPESLDSDSEEEAEQIAHSLYSGKHVNPAAQERQAHRLAQLRKAAMGHLAPASHTVDLSRNVDDLSMEELEHILDLRRRGDKIEDIRHRAQRQRLAEQSAITASAKNFGNGRQGNLGGRYDESDDESDIDAFESEDETPGCVGNLREQDHPQAFLVIETDVLHEKLMRLQSGTSYRNFSSKMVQATMEQAKVLKRLQAILRVVARSLRARSQDSDTASNVLSLRHELEFLGNSIALLDGKVQAIGIADDASKPEEVMKLIDRRWNMQGGRPRAYKDVVIEVHSSHAYAALIAGHGGGGGGNRGSAGKMSTFTPQSSTTSTAKPAASGGKGRNNHRNRANKNSQERRIVPYKGNGGDAAPAQAAAV